MARTRSTGRSLAVRLGILVAVPFWVSPCTASPPDFETPLPPVTSAAGDSAMNEPNPDATDSRGPRGEANDAQARDRRRMVKTQIEARGVADPLVLEAMRSVPRHEFVPDRWRDGAYEDRPLPIGLGQTISQPYIVAAMTELARLRPGTRVLEIGTGSGYQAAVIHEITGEVYSIEIVGELAERARATLDRLGYRKAHLRHGNGYLGWPDRAPFDAILVTAAPPEVPQALLEQLAEGGRLVVPVGTGFQQLEVHTRTAEGIERETIFGVRFVPMVEEVREGTGPQPAP